LTAASTARDRSGSGAERWLAAATFVVPLLAYTAIYFADGTAFHPSGDGYYSWIFARSLVFGGDLDFHDDYALCGDPFDVGRDRGTGHPDNPFYVGPAVFWVPQLAVLRGVFTLLFGAARAAHASCGGWMTALTILAGPVCGALTVWLAYRTARLVVSPVAAAFSSLLFAFTSPLFPYSTSVAHYSHVYLTCAVAALTYLSFRIVLRGPRPRDGLWIAAAVAVAILHRTPAAAYALVAVPAFVSAAGRGNRLRIGIGVASGVALGFALTCALYLYLYGKAMALPQGPDYVHPAHAHPWLLLFGVHGGFFFWMPVAWLAVAGVPLALARHPRLRWLTIFCLLASLAEIAVSSAPLDWHGNWSLGARRLLPLTPFVIVFSSLVVERAVAAVPSRWSRPVAAAIVVMVLVNNIPASTTIRGDKELSQAELYGALSPLRPLWSALDGIGIDVALMPAEVYFALRYGLPTRSYREVLKPRYRRRYRDLVFSDIEIDLRDPGAAEIVSGGRWSDRGMEVTDRESHLVFASEWPFATHLRLLVSGDPGTHRLSVAVGHGFGGRTDAGTVPLALTEGEPSTWVELALPPDAFDSGIDDWTFRTDGARLVVSVLALEDRTPRTPFGSMGPARSTPTLTRSSNPGRSLPMRATFGLAREGTHVTRRLS
jgi:hypothetical protein